MSDVAATITRFPGSGAIGEMDSLYAYWATDRPHGFDDAHVAAIAELMPMLALAVKYVSLARVGRRPNPGKPVAAQGSRNRIVRTHAVVFHLRLTQSQKLLI
jgi:adenylate cyclase